MTPNEEFLLARVSALEKELKRVNEELGKVKVFVEKIDITDPNFYKPLNDINIDYEHVTK